MSMSKPKIFYSASFFDISPARSSLESFTGRLGYEASFSEKEKFAFDMDIALDDTCYRGISNSDIFVMIIGGRNLSSRDMNINIAESQYLKRYEDISKNEFELALSRDIPIYVLVDKAVYLEMETYRRNRDNSSIKYAHVDSINVFQLLERIASKSNKVLLKEFQSMADIEDWLLSQWAMLMRSLIRDRAEDRKLNTISDKVEELAVLNSSLQRYMETVVSSVSKSPDEAKKIINLEKELLETEKNNRKFFNIPFIRKLNMLYDISRDDAKNCFTDAKSLDDLSQKIHDKSRSKILVWHTEDMIKNWKDNPNSVKELNNIREILKLNPLAFEDVSELRMIDKNSNNKSVISTSQAQ